MVEREKVREAIAKVEQSSNFAGVCSSGFVPIRQDDLLRELGLTEDDLPDIEARLHQLGCARRPTKSRILYCVPEDLR